MQDLKVSIYLIKPNLEVNIYLNKNVKNKINLLQLKY